MTDTPGTTSASVVSWISAYWNGLKTKLDVIDPLIYPDLAADAAVHYKDYDIGGLTEAEKTRVQALLICVEAAGMPSLAGWSQERHLTHMKISDKTIQKPITNYDWAIGELCRLLRITLERYLTIRSNSDRSSRYTKVYTTNNAFLAPDLDTRAQVHRDFTLQDKVNNYVPRPNKFNPDYRLDRRQDTDYQQQGGGVI
jgi:hypothetical protein